MKRYLAICAVWVVTAPNVGLSQTPVNGAAATRASDKLAPATSTESGVAALPRLEDLRLLPQSLEVVSPAQIDLVDGSVFYTAATASHKFRELTLGYTRQASPSFWYAVPLTYQRPTGDKSDDQVRIAPAVAYKVMDKLVIGASYEARFWMQESDRPLAQNPQPVPQDDGGLATEPLADEVESVGTASLGLRLKSERFDAGLAERIPVSTPNSREREARGQAAHGRVLVSRDLALGALYERRSDDEGDDRTAAFVEIRRGTYLVQALGGEKEGAFVVDRSFGEVGAAAESRFGLSIERRRTWDRVGGGVRYSVAL